MPIVVDVLFVGLDGSGHLGVQLPDEDVREWMEHLDHIIPHSVLRTTDVSSEQRERHSQADDLLESAGDLGAPSSPRIQYRYRTRFVRLSSKVTDVIERHLSVHHRVDLSEPSGDAFQVDPEGLTQLLESLAEYIGLTESDTHSRGGGVSEACVRVVKVSLFGAFSFASPCLRRARVPPCSIPARTISSF